MIDLPPPGQSTLAELNNRLLHVDADSTAEVPGLSYPDISLNQVCNEDEEAAQVCSVFMRDGTTTCLIPLEDGADPWRKPMLQRLGAAAGGVAGPVLQPLRLLQRWMMGYSLTLVPGISSTPSASSALDAAASGAPPSSPAAPPPVAWHPHKSTLAVSDSTGRLRVYDMSAAEAGSSPNGNVWPAGNGSIPPSPKVVLSHRLQTQVYALAWRPCSGAVLAAGCRGLVCLWSVGGGGTRPPVTTRVAGGTGAGRGSGPWLTVLPAPHPEARVSALSWSPDGRYLAVASPDAPGIAVWDVSYGTRTLVGAGLSALTLLRWSPCGAYLFGAGVGPRFHVWETSHWQRASWDAPPASGPVAQAAWAPPPSTSSPSPRVLLVSFARSGAPACAGPTSPLDAVLPEAGLGGGGSGGHLVALHLVQEPPSLVAQLMPVLLQDVTARVEGEDGQREGGNGRAGSQGVIGDWAWDPRGERLVVALRKPHPAAGCVALYATSVDPVVHARLLGYARPPWSAANANGTAPDVPNDVSVTAHGAFARGALFSLRAQAGSAGAGDVVYNLPAYYR